MKQLPDLQPTPIEYAQSYGERVFGERLVVVKPQPENVYRALFRQAYFTIQPGNDKPSRSQWNTLKKRMKRVHPGVFVLREYGETQHAGQTVCYIDFGFLPDPA